MSSLKVPIAYERATTLDFILFVCFVWFLYPLSVNGLSVNYSFILFPIFIVAVTGKIRKPPDAILLFAGIYALLFVAASVYQYGHIDQWLRRAASFIAFMSAFSFMLIHITDRMVKAFTAAIVAIALYFSVKSVVVYVLSGGAELHFDAKDIIGGQRFGFVTIMAFWLVFMSSPQTTYANIRYLIMLLTLVVGVGLTFSRAAFVALGVSILIYGILAGYGWRRRYGLTVRSHGLLGLVGAVLIVLMFNAFFPVVFEFFNVRFIEFVFNPDTVMSHLTNAESSEGTRLYIWGRIVEFVAANPLLGSGYLGVWTLDLFGDGSGSAHSQYFDTLLRVGVVGSAIYAYLLYRTSRFLRDAYPAIFWGFGGILLYGLFHETFKESHGGFILAFLFGMMSQSPISKRTT